MPIPAGFVSHIDLLDPLCYPGSGLIIEDLQSPSTVWNISASGTTYDGTIGALTLTTQSIEANTLLVPTGTAAITIAGWIKVNSYTYANVFNALPAVGSNASGNSFRQYPLYGATANAVAVASASNVPTGGAVYGASEQPINEWCFVVITKAAGSTTNQIITYLNGVNDVGGNYGTNVTTNITYSGTFSYGAINSTKFTDNQNNMSVSQFWIYNSELSSGDVLDLYNATAARYAPAPPAPAIISQIDFIDPSCFTNGGTAVTDLSGNGNNWALQSTSYTYNAAVGTLDLPTGNALIDATTGYYSGNVPFTVSFWFYYGAAFDPEYRCFYNGGYPSAGWVELHTLGGTDGQMRFVVNGANLDTAVGTLIGGQHNYITLTYDGTTFNGYINNVLEVTTTGPINQSTSNNMEFNLSAYNPNGLDGLGLIYFYDGAIDSTERTNLYDEGVTRFAPPAPVAEYSPFDIASYPGTGNTWFDLSANNNDLALSNQTFATTPVKSFTFANGYANNPTPTNLPTNIFTIDAWIKFNSTSQQILYGVGKDVGGGGQEALLIYKFPGVNSGKPFVEMGSGVGPVNFNLDPVIGQWYNITWSADGTTTRLYVDGVLDNSGAQGGQIGATSSGIILGQLIDGTGGPSGLYYSDASFGQFNIYNEALDAGTILQNYDDNVINYITPPPSSNGVGGRQFAQGFNG